LRSEHHSKNVQVLGGTAGAEGINIEDMMQHCQYKGGYTKTSPTIRMFWKAVTSFDIEGRRLLLKFITGTRRAPLGGFANLAPPLVIYKVDCQAPVMACFAGPDVERLPSASTCFSTLKLPNYRRFSTLRSKVLYAITSKAGFDLS
jgi:ubiquitin-protein ligase E3 B